MRTAKKNNAFIEVIAPLDFDGVTKLSGLTISGGGFTVLFYRNGSTVTSPTHSITEIGSTGNYSFSATFPTTGYWYVSISTVDSSSSEVIEVFEINVDVSLYTIDEIYTSLGGGGGTGSESVVITVQDTNNSNAVVPLVNLNIYNSSKSAFITFGKTDTLGKRVFNLDPGTYKVSGFLPGYSFTDATLTVTDTSGGTEQSLTFSTASITVTAPASPDLCRVYADFIKQDGTAVSGFKVSVTNLFDPVSSQGLTVIEKETIYTSNTSGHVEMDLYQGLKVRISLIGSSITRDVVIPSKPVENLFNILGPASDPFKVVDAPVTSFAVVGVG